MINRKQLALMCALSNNTSTNNNNNILVEPHDDACVKISLEDNKLKVDTADLTKHLASISKSITTLNKKQPPAPAPQLRKCIIGCRFSLGKTILYQWGEQKLEATHFGKYDGSLAITFPTELPSNDFGINITSNAVGIVGYANASKSGLTLITYLHTGAKSILNNNFEVNLEIVV